MNKVICTGNLGRDVDVKYTQAGKAVASFSIAVTEKWTTDGEKKERTDWINITAWGKLGELCGQYLLKGSKVLVEGKIQTRSYDDKNGVKKYVTEINAQAVEFLSPKRSSEASDSNEDAGRYQGGGGGGPVSRDTSAIDDDIPF